MTKTKAALIHLSISILVIALFFILVKYIWYPKPFFSLSGVIEPFKLLILIDVILGPLLTFVVYKKFKKSLKLDLSIIVILQIVALIYGSYIIYNGRPTMVVFNNGKFQYLVEKFAKNDELVYEELKPNLFSKPKMAYIKNFNAMEIYNGYAYFEPLSDYESMLKGHSMTLENMKAKFTSKASELDDIVKKYQNEDIVFMQLNHKGSFHYVVYSINQNYIIDYLKF